MTSFKKYNFFAITIVQLTKYSDFEECLAKQKILVFKLTKTPSRCDSHMSHSTELTLINVFFF
jgi:hypothetical protein